MASTHGEAAAEPNTRDNMESDETKASVKHGSRGDDDILELLRLSMRLRFMGSQFNRQEKLEMLQSLEWRMRTAARELVLEDIDDDDEEDKSDVSLDDLLSIPVAPPRAWFVFQNNGRMHLPLIDWSAFRGYTFTMWINIQEVADNKATFHLFRFANASGTLGVEALLEFGEGVTVTVRSCAPNIGSDQKRSTFGAAVVAAIAPSVTNAPSSSDWKGLSHPIQLQTRQWQLLVITHSLHYVKKSRVACYVDTKQQFCEELIYPSGLVQATKATVGGGTGVKMHVASASMYHEEVGSSVVETIYLQGPSVWSFRRWKTMAHSSTVDHIVDLMDTHVLSPFSVLTPELASRVVSLVKLQVVFSFSAVDGVDDQSGIYSDTSVEWIAEGIMGSKGKWVSLESVSASSEIQQRNARIGKGVHKKSGVQSNLRTRWFRSLGIEAVPILLDYALFASEAMASVGARDEDETSARDIEIVVSKLITDTLSILRGLLLNDSTNINQVIRDYLLHQLYHVMRRHIHLAASIWTPSNIVACVEIIRGIVKLSAWTPVSDRSLHHPTQPSVWAWNPLFASAVRAWLLDYRVWSTLSFKNQSIYNHQLYSLACEYPKLMNDLNVVSRLLEVLKFYFTSAAYSDCTGEVDESGAPKEQEKDQHWKLQCIQTITETIEVCLVNQSVHVHGAVEQEILETTYAGSTTASGGPTLTSGGTQGGNSTPSTNEDEAPSLPLHQQNKGGVFYVNLENIIWSDQSSSTEGQHWKSDDRQHEQPFPTASVLPHVQIRFSLLRDLRSVARFLVSCDEPAVVTALLQLVRRLSVAYLDIRFGLISSNIVDVLLVLIRPVSVISNADANRSEVSKRATEVAELRLACVPFLIYLLDWLESVEGRTVWCGLEEHLRSVLNGEGNFTRGFLDLMMEFYFDPAALSGVQQSIIMNDPSKKDSVLFPMSPITNSKLQGTLIHDSGIVAMNNDGLRSDNDNEYAAGGGVGMVSWIKLATSFCGRKLSLSWEKRVQVIRMAALRSLTIGISHPAALETATNPSAGLLGGDSASVTEVYDKGVVGILNLPMRSILPFLPALLVHTSTVARDRVLMELNVKLKTGDIHDDHQILMMKKDWVEALLELYVVSANCSGDDASIFDYDERLSVDSIGSDTRLAHRSTARSFDAHKTGEDLVVDAIVSVLCGAMEHPRGWRAFSDLISALRVMQRKYSVLDEGSIASTSLAPASSIPAVFNQSDIFHQIVLLVEPLEWLSRLTGIVIQKMARSRTILSKTLTENLHKVLLLVQEALLETPHQTATRTGDSEASRPQRISGTLIWSEAQIFLLKAVVDVCSRLVDSTHKAYRCGLVPGLQVLQRSLSYIPSTSDAILIRRITSLLEKAFQQEMNVASAVRVYEHLSPRDVFLSALVCLRRAVLVLHGEKDGSESESLEALHLLILKLCTSEVFLDDLHTNGLTVDILSELTEHEAVAAVLDALGISINEAEMHEREEEADLVPLFPVAKELRRVDTTVDGETDVTDVRHSEDLGPDPFAIAFAGTAPTSGTKSFNDVDDANERSLWAVLEVEENRMTEALRDVVAREKVRYNQLQDFVVPRRDTWTARLWTVHEYRFRTLHAHDVLPSPTSSLILREFGYRIGSYESPAPGRMRKPLDVAFPIDEASHVTSSSAQLRRMSMAIDPHVSSDGRQTGEDNRQSDEDQLLLERVGRVVAEQGGGEIKDITTESFLVDSDPSAYQGRRDDGESVANQALDEPDSPSKRDQEPENTTENADGDQQNDVEAIPGTRHQANGTVASVLSLPSAFWFVDAERHKECGFDPSEGIALAPGEQILAQAKCRRVIPEGMVSGNLYFCSKYLIFVPLYSSTDRSVGEKSFVDEAAPGQRRCWRWKYKHIVGAFLRRFRLRDSALELFLLNGSTHFLDFPHVVKQQRNELARLLFSFLPRNVPKQWPGRAIPNLATTVKAWQNRQLSNYEYLMALNTYAGRSFNDLTQYPVFPWVIRNYEADVLDLSDPHNFRDLSKPMGALNPDRLEEYWERYHSFDDPVIPKFLYGSHYSTCAGVVLFFLVRMQPFADLHRRMQGGSFDLPDRMFHSIEETWHMCNSQMSEVKELTPEFYSDPSFLKNLNSYDFGKRHDQRRVENVVLPKWANGSPEEFVRLQRAALESEYVSQHLNEWIDLIFGFKQRGKAALKANNVFYYLTYYGVVDLDRIEDPFIRESMELQIAHFGQCPMQLFNSPHPKRNAPVRRYGVPRAVSDSSGVSVTTNAPSGPASLASPGLRSPVGVSPAVSSAVSRPLSSMFHDVSPSAQEQRRQWSPTVALKPIARSAIRWIKIFPDRFITVNELGVVELFNWKLIPKPQQTIDTSGEADSLLKEGIAQSAVGGSMTPAVTHDKPDFVNRVGVSESQNHEDSGNTSRRPSIEGEDTRDEEMKPSTVPLASCPWLLEVIRDDSPFEVVPRIPVFEDSTARHCASSFFPITSSLNGRVLVSGGAPNGSIQLRLLDLDNGHVLAKASVTGHDAAVTCLSVDRFSQHNSPIGSHYSDGDELLVSGSKDKTLAVWRLSRTKPDMLFRPPRVSSSPVMILRGHKTPIIDCSLNTYLNVVVSCSIRDALVHFLHDNGMVAFRFHSSELWTGAKFVSVAASSKGFIVALVHFSEDEVSSACVVYNLAGVCILKKVFESESITQMQLSAEGDLVILTVQNLSVVRLCRLDDFTPVQEYETTSQSAAGICVTTFGPDEATILGVTGLADGTMVLHLLPDADGSVSLLGNLSRLLGVNAKLKMVKGTVQQAQNLAWTTLGSAKAVTSTARDIAGEAIGEAKSIVKGFISYLRQNPGT